MLPNKCSGNIKLQPKVCPEIVIYPKDYVSKRVHINDCMVDLTVLVVASQLPAAAQSIMGSNPIQNIYDYPESSCLV